MGRRRVLPGEVSVHHARAVARLIASDQSTRVMWEFNRIYRNIETSLTDAAQFTELLLAPLRPLL